MFKENGLHRWDASEVLDIPDQGSGSIRRCSGLRKGTRDVRCKNPSPARRRDEADMILKRMTLSDPLVLRDDMEELTELASTTLCHHHTAQVGAVVKHFQKTLNDWVRQDKQKQKAAAPKKKPRQIEGGVGTRHGGVPVSSECHHSAVRPKKEQRAMAQRVPKIEPRFKAEDVDTFSAASDTPSDDDNL